MVDPDLLRRMMMGDYSAQNAEKNESEERRPSKKEVEIIDLHADKLFKGKPIPKQLPEAQVSALLNHIERVQKLSIKNLIVIHGKGDAVLIKAVHHKLKFHASVLNYRQIHDIPYLGGATRITLK